MFMNLYSVEVNLCANIGGSDGGADPKTCQKWVWHIINSLAKLEYHVIRITIQHLIFHSIIYQLAQILLENRWKNDDDSDCLLCVDATYFRMSNWDKKFYSNRFNGNAWNYEAVLSIQ